MVTRDVKRLEQLKNKKRSWLLLAATALFVLSGLFVLRSQFWKDNSPAAEINRQGDPADIVANNLPSIMEAENSGDVERKRPGEKKEDSVAFEHLSELLISQPTTEYPDLREQAIESFAIADRVSVIRVDTGQLVYRLSFTPAFLYERAGRSPPLERGDQAADLFVSFFQDELLGLHVKSVSITEHPDGEIIIFKGDVVIGGEGQFRFSTRDKFNSLNGTIDTPIRRIRVVTWKDAPAPVVAEISHRKLDELGMSID